MSRLNKMMRIAAAFFASSLATAFAERLAISSGDCEIAFDSQTGAVLDMSYKGNPLGLKFRPDLCVVKYYNKALQPLKTSQMKIKTSHSICSTRQISEKYSKRQENFDGIFTHPFLERVLDHSQDAVAYDVMNIVDSNSP